MSVHPEGLSVRKWQKLVQSVVRGQCVVMLGPDAVTVRAPGGGRVPVHEALRRSLVTEMVAEGIPEPDAARVSAVAEVIEDVRDRDQLLEWVADFYDSVALDDPTIAGLSRLPIGLMVNTVPGLALEQVLSPSPLTRVYNRFGSTEQLPDWSPEGLLLYHLYGSLQQPDSVVLTDSDLVDLLVSVVRGDPPLPTRLTSVFQDPDLTFVFLGFQLYHWQRRVLLHVLNEGTSATDSFAQETARDDLDEGTRTFYRVDHRIRIVEMAPETFVSGLLGEIDSDSARELAQANFTPDDPAVFIVHADGDKDRAEDVSRRLQDRGLNTWLDKFDIPGGSEWDRLIERTLEHEVGYVVVLETEEFLARRETESYLNKEIRIALRRQEKIANGRVFTIPVLADRAAATAPDPALAHLQAISLLEPDGVDRLVRVLKRDIEREAKR